jgi:DNA helicase-2/ATP-dependent DNA helicase PcrA
MTPSAPPWLDRLNPQQHAAVTWGTSQGDGRVQAAPLLVIAGAGTGKTATLAHRVAWLVEQGVDPARILLITFSRRAAQEMARRAGQAVAQTLNTGSECPRAQVALQLPWAGTFHAVAARLLRLHASALGLDPGFGVLDRSDAADLIDLIRHEQGWSATRSRFPRKDTCLAIASFALNTGRPLREVLAQGWPWCLDWHDALRNLFSAYAERKQTHHVLDFDDLLLAWEAALSDPQIAAQMAARFDHILVDEYQDTNTLQAGILRALSPQGAGLMAVGDDAQSIYAFRGACINHILTFGEQFDPPAQRITLQRNYRSVQPVLDCANALMAGSTQAYPKSLQAARGPGARPVLATVADERAQADRVISGVLAQRETGVPLKEQAVLFRNAQHSEWLEVELTRRKIPFVKHGGLRFMDAAHVKDVLAVLRWMQQPRDALAGFRVLQCLPGMGPALAERALAVCAAHERLSAGLSQCVSPAAAAAHWEALIALTHDIEPREARWRGQFDAVCTWYQPLLERRYRDGAAVRAADLQVLAAMAGHFGSREQFLTELALDPPSASGDLAGAPYRDEDYLILSTVHSAKGQEWDAVWVLNVTDGNFPNEYATGAAHSIEEERRLLYVAMTRARNTLELIEPRAFAVTHQPRLGDRHVTGARSRFLDEAVLATLEGVPSQVTLNDCDPCLTPPVVPGGTAAAAAGSGAAQSATDHRQSAVPRVDVAARLRSRW